MATKTNNKKMIVTGGIILGVAGLAYLFRKKIKNYFVPNLMPGEDGGGIQIIKDIISGDPNALPAVDPNAVAPYVAPYVAPSETAWVPPASIDIDAKLKKGMKDENVKLLQYNIREIQNINGIYPLIGADGNFGGGTEKMLLQISDFYKKNGYWTIRRARETMARYAGQKKKAFPKYLENVSNAKDLKKIYDATIVKKIVDGTLF